MKADVGSEILKALPEVVVFTVKNLWPLELFVLVVVITKIVW